MTAIIYQHLKKFIKIGEFLYSHFNTEHGRKYTTFQHIRLYYFKKGKNKQQKICAVRGEGAVTDRMCHQWFGKFQAGELWLDDALQLGRPVEVDGDQIETLRTINVIPPRR